MRLWGFLIFFFAFLGLQPLAQAREIQNLEEFRKVLIERSPFVTASKQSWVISSRQKDSAYGALWPTLDLSSSLVADHQSDPEPLDSTQTSITLNANFFNSQLDWYSYKIASYQERIAELEYYTQFSNMVLNGLNLYLDYSDSYVSLDVAQQRQKLVQEQYSGSRRSYRSGTSTRLDFLRLQSEIKSSEFEVRRAQTEYEKAKNRLRALFGSDAEDLKFKPLVFGPKRELPPIKAELSTDTHPEYQIEWNRIKTAELEVQKAKRRFWPRLSFGTELIKGLSGYWVDGETAGWGTDWRTTLSVSFNLFDGGRLSNDLANQRSQVIINTANADLTHMKLDSEIKNLRIEAVRLQDQVQTAIEILKIDTQVFNSIAREYRVGNIDYLDFINSLNQRLSAQLNLQTSISSYLKTYYSSLYYKGTLLHD